MRLFAPIGIAALALTACGGETETNNSADTETTVFQDEGGTTDPATTDLNLDSGESEVDQAVNQTEAEANLGDTVGDTTGGDNQN